MKDLDDEKRKLLIKKFKKNKYGKYYKIERYLKATNIKLLDVTKIEDTNNKEIYKVKIRRSINWINPLSWTLIIYILLKIVIAIFLELIDLIKDNIEEMIQILSPRIFLETILINKHKENE